MINVIPDPDGLWNFENPAISKDPRHDGLPAPFPFGVISKVELRAVDCWVRT